MLRAYAIIDFLADRLVFLNMVTYVLVIVRWDSINYTGLKNNNNILSACARLAICTILGKIG